jgi:hypothetical protein
MGLSPCLWLQVHPSAWNFTGTASGEIIFTVESPPRLGEGSPQRSEVRVPLKVPIVPTPPRETRLLWDQFHNLKYPPGYVPRDNLDIKVRGLLEVTQGLRSGSEVLIGQGGDEGGGG